MVEVIIAITILTVGVLAMASTTAFVVRQTTFADLMTERAASKSSGMKPAHTVSSPLLQPVHAPWALAIEARLQDGAVQENRHRKYAVEQARPGIELVGGVEHDLASRQLGEHVDERRGVLELVSEAEGTAGLVVAAARPQAAGHRLVDQPAVDQHVQRRVRCLDLHRTEDLLRAPVLTELGHEVLVIDASEEAGNRLHAQKGLLAVLMGQSG